MAYTYRNSRGKLCYLHSRLARLPSGRLRRYYFFAYRPQPALVEPALPAGFEIIEAYGTGFPAVRRIEERRSDPTARIAADQASGLVAHAT